MTCLKHVSVIKELKHLLNRILYMALRIRKLIDVAEDWPLYEEAEQRYHLHISKIMPTLSLALVLFADDSIIHDSRIADLKWDPPKHQVDMWVEYLNTNATNTLIEPCVHLSFEDVIILHVDRYSMDAYRAVPTIILCEVDTALDECAHVTKHPDTANMHSLILQCDNSLCVTLLFKNCMINGTRSSPRIV